MKIASIIGILIAIALIIVNVNKVDFNNPLEGDSTVALIGLVAGLIVIVLILLLNISRAIQQKSKQ